MASTSLKHNKTALITGAARRIGAVTATQLHAAGCNVVIHYHHSVVAANALAEQLNAKRSDSAITLAADLLDTDACADLVHQAAKHWGRLDILINNASSFYPTPMGGIDLNHWHDLVGTNLQAPLFLTQAALPYLQNAYSDTDGHTGAVVNLIDTQPGQTRAKHAVYGSAKAGLAALTKILAKDLAPQIRVNGVAPGVILWPEDHAPDDNASDLQTEQLQTIRNIPLQKQGTPNDIAQTVRFLALEHQYLTGQIIAVDGGQSL